MLKLAPRTPILRATGCLAACLLFALAVVPSTANAHRDGCHRWHSCPSDTGSYVCGDLGYYSECPGSGGGRSTPRPPKKRARAPRPKRAQVISGRLTWITDGDTVRVRAYGAKRRNYKVRLIGIDTPETRQPGTSIECGGPEATDYLERLGMRPSGRGRGVVLKTDPTQDKFDRYDRLLAYVRVRGGVQLNRAQVRAGWSRAYVYGGKPFRQYPSFRRAQRRARSAGRGAWSQCGGRFHAPAPAGSSILELGGSR